MPIIEQFLRQYPPDIQDLANDLRQVVKLALPNIEEAVYPGWKLIGYRLPHRRRTVYVGYVAPHSQYVALGFEYGVLLADPAGILTGSGTQVRQVIVRQASDIRPELLTPLITQAAHVATLSKEQKSRLFMAHPPNAQNPLDTPEN